VSTDQDDNLHFRFFNRSLKTITMNMLQALSPLAFTFCTSVASSSSNQKAETNNNKNNNIITTTTTIKMVGAHHPEFQSIVRQRFLHGKTGTHKQQQQQQQCHMSCLAWCNNCMG
jgi:hypothetical protein